MKKRRFLSALTSMAVASSMMLSAVPFTTASAANPLGLSLSSAKTSYSLDEIKAGASAKVYVDLAGTVSESDHIGTLEFCLKPDQWGKTDVDSLMLSEENALATDKGSTVWMGTYNQTATLTYSTWSNKQELKEIIDLGPGYGILNIYDAEGDSFVYDDDHMPKASISSDSSHGFFRNGAGEHIAEFNVNFPTDLAEGKYTINFSDAKCGVFPSANFAGDDARMDDVTNTTGITFTIGSGEGPVQETTTTPEPVVTTTTTKAPDVTTTTKVTEDVTPINTVVPVLDPKKEYNGKATIKADRNVKGEVGETVNVPVYVELDSGIESIEAIAFRAVYDNSALELSNILYGRMLSTLDPSYGSGGLASGAADSNVAENIFLYAANTEASVTVDSSKPACVLQFTVKEGASGEYPISFANHLSDDNTTPIEIVRTQIPGEPNVYLEPVVSPGSVVVGDVIAVDTTTTKNDDIPDPILDPNKKYNGQATIKAEKNVKGDVGDTVDVPVYVELGSGIESIEAIAFRAVYDNSALELSNILYGRMLSTLDPSYGSGGLASGAADSNVAENIFLYAANTEASVTVDSSKPACVLQFTIKEGASGEYPISFANHLADDLTTPIEIVRTQLPGQDNVYLEPVVDAGSVVVGDALVTTTTTAAPDITTTTTTSNEGEQPVLDPKKIYEGSATIRAEKNVKGEVGDTVDVPVYVELGSGIETIEAIAFRAVYNDSALELSDILYGRMLSTVDPSYGSGGLASGAADSNVAENIFLYAANTEASVTVDSSKPACVLRFTIKEGASGEYPISFANHLSDDLTTPIEIVRTQLPGEPNVYLEPVVDAGSIVVGDDIVTTTTTTTEAPIDTTTTTTTTTIAPVIDTTTTTTQAPVVDTTTTTTQAPVIDTTTTTTQAPDIVTTTTTTQTPVNTTPAVTTTKNFVTDPNKEYNGDATIIGESNVKGNPGDTVYVPVYMQVSDGVESIEAVAFRAIYNEAGLELTNIIYGRMLSTLDPSYGSGGLASGAADSNVAENIFLYAANTEASVTVDPTKPVCVLEFKIKDGASGIYPISFGNHLADKYDFTTPIEIVRTQLPGQPNVYLEPHVIEGSVVVGDSTEVVTTTPDASVVTTTTTKTPDDITTTTTTKNGGDVTTTTTLPDDDVIEFKIIDEESQWYYADETDWHLDGIEVYMNGEKIDNLDASELTFSVDGVEGATPNTTYDPAKKQFDYVVTIGYKGATDTFDAKIGLRGDADMNHVANIRDAAAIAKELAQSSLTKKTTFKDRFAIFLANVDEGAAKATALDAYKPFGFDVRDAATIAKWLARKSFDKNLELWTVAGIKR